MTNYKAKRDYLVERLIDGARVLNEFFGSLIKEPSANPKEVVKEVSTKYNLTENQKRKLGRVTSRVTKATEIVDYLKDKYGVTRQGTFRNKNGLYREIYGEKPPKEIFSAKPFSFAIGFYLPTRYFDENTLGATPDEPFVLNQFQRSFYKKEQKFNPTALSFKVNYRRLPVKQLKEPTDKILQVLFPKHDVKKYATERRKYVVKQHELKHVLDGLLGLPYARELSASLFAGGQEIETQHNLLKDVNRAQESLEVALQRYERLKQLNPSQFILDNEQKLIDGYKKLIKDIKVSVELAQKIAKKDLDHKVLSYIIATTPVKRLKHRLELVDDYLNRHLV